MHSPCSSFDIASMGEGGQCSNDKDGRYGTITTSPRPVEIGRMYHLRETSSLLCVQEGRAAYLALGALLYLVDDDGGDNSSNGRKKGGEYEAVEAA